MQKSTSGLKIQTPSISDEQIREQAHDIWERHHRPEGFEMHFWLMAKRELIAEHEVEMGFKVASDSKVGSKAR